MFMKRIHAILNAIFCTAIVLSCDAAEAQNSNTEFPMDSFAVKSGGMWYHANIDQNTHVAIIGVIQYLGSIADLSSTGRNGNRLDKGVSELNLQKRYVIVGKHLSLPDM